MNAAKFRQKVLECRFEFEVRRLVLWHGEEIIGTRMEIEDALMFADNHALRLTDDGAEIGDRPDRGCQMEIIGVLA